MIAYLDQVIRIHVGCLQQVLRIVKAASCWSPMTLQTQLFNGFESEELGDNVLDDRENSRLTTPGSLKPCEESKVLLSKTLYDVESLL